MKTLLLFLFALSASLAGASFTTGRIPDAALIFASVFSATLTAWTLQQYDRQYFPLTRERLLRPTLSDTRRETTARPRRLAA
jgi:hypothetical protein